MKLIVELKSITAINFFKKHKEVSHLLIGLKETSLTPVYNFSIDEILKIKEKIKNTHLKLILNAEKLFTDLELDNIKKILQKLPFDVIEYITYSDFGFFQILEELSLAHLAIFRAPTYLTNQFDVKIYKQLNNNVVLSSEISSEELIALSNSLNFDVIVDLFGQTECFYSRRKLLTNYFIYRNTKKEVNNKRFNIIEELRNEAQPIVEDEAGTYIFEPHKHYLLEELNLIDNIKMGIIHSNFLTNKQIEQIVLAYINYFDNNNSTEFYQKLDELKIDYYKGAYDIKSVLLKGGNPS